MTCDFKDVREASMANIMAKTTEGNGKNFEGSEDLLAFGRVGQQVASVHD